MDKIFAGIVLALLLLAVASYRKRPWSRLFAVCAAAVCFHMSLIIIPPFSPTYPGEQDLAWDDMLVRILGRLIFAALLVSGAQLRFIWQKPRTQAAKPRDPDDGFQLY